MSGEARKALHNELSQWLNRDEAGVADELIDAFAHELAEEIRAEAATWEGWPEKQNSMGLAADLIDLEVNS